MARFGRGDRVRLEQEQQKGLFGSVKVGTLGVVLKVEDGWSASCEVAFEDGAQQWVKEDHLSSY